MTHPTPPCAVHVLVACAGSGTRAQTPNPKQYHPLLEVPVVVHSLRAFAQLTGWQQGVLVVSPSDPFIDAVLASWPQPRFRTARVGGTTRAASVVAGLSALRDGGAANTDWVLVHDAARCLVTPEDLRQLITVGTADACGALLAQPAADTLKRAEQGRVAQTVERADIWLAQTPQMFRLGMLLQAYAHAGESVTDEASAIESLGGKPLLVAAKSPNFKLTHPVDFALAEALLRNRAPTPETP